MAYFAYKFIFDFLVPVLKVSGRMRRQMKEFQQRAEQQQPPVEQATNANKHTSTAKSKIGDYIDFEEVKEK